MKYSVKQMRQALKDGKVIWFYHEGSGDILYKGYLEDDRIQVKWEDGEISYPFNSKDTILEYWVCTKIEGEETVEQKPHKHAELIKKWADGAIIQYKDWARGEWVTCTENKPTWNEQSEYRVKPVKVNKWRWVCEFTNYQLFVTEDHYSELEAYKNFNVIQKIDSTMIEVEE